MTLSQEEFEEILSDRSKTINGDIIIPDHQQADLFL